jgi:hypothetical protein
MKLSQVKNILKSVQAVNFILSDGTAVPEHFHVTEVGLITKNFIDCGGTIRKETVVNFQLWDANDFEHRLKPEKLLNIIELAAKIIGTKDLEIEVEYQQKTIGKYDLDFNGNDFVLLNKQTACLAQDQCRVPAEKQKVKISNISIEPNRCAPGGSCC